MRITKQTSTTTVTKLVMHDAQHYAVTELLLLHAAENRSADGIEVVLKTKTLTATPNHPLPSNGKRKTIR